MKIMDILEKLPAELTLKILAQSGSVNGLYFYSERLRQKPYCYWLSINLSEIQMLKIFRDGSQNLIELILRKDIPENVAFRALNRAVIGDNLMAVKLLLIDQRFDPVPFQHVCMKNALENKNIEMLQLLVDDPRTSYDKITLHMAVKCNSFNQVCRSLPTSNVKEIYSVLNIAILNNNFAIVKKLLADKRVDRKLINLDAIPPAAAMGLDKIIFFILKFSHFLPKNLDRISIISAVEGRYYKLAKFLFRDPRFTLPYCDKHNFSEMKTLILQVEKDGYPKFAKELVKRIRDQSDLSSDECRII